MFAYPDAQRYRLGVNYAYLPPNRAICPVYTHFERDSMGIVSNYGAEPNYVRSSLTPGVPSQRVSFVRYIERLLRNAALGLNEMSVDEEDYQQPRELWNRVFNASERSNWVSNVSEALEGVPEELRVAVQAMFSKVDSQIGQLIADKFKESSRL